MARILQFEAFAIFAGTVDPNGNETPTSRGDLYLRTDAGQVRFFQNTDGTNTGWAEVALQGGDALTAITINLVDNTAPALTVQTSGFDNMVRISTTNGSESISIGEGLITGLASAVADYAVETLTPTFILRSDHAGGNAEDPFTLPPRTGGWRLVDAYIRSTGRHCRHHDPARRDRWQCHDKRHGARQRQCRHACNLAGHSTGGRRERRHPRVVGRLHASGHYLLLNLGRLVAARGPQWHGSSAKPVEARRC